MLNLAALITIVSVKWFVVNIKSRSFLPMHVIYFTAVVCQPYFFIISFSYVCFFNNHMYAYVHILISDCCKLCVYLLYNLIYALTFGPIFAVYCKVGVGGGDLSTLVKLLSHWLGKKQQK